jgi:hypothetical protein
MGRINMAKCHMTSKLNYVAAVLPSPGEEFWKEVNKKLFTYLANNKQEKIKRKILIEKTNNGGAQMIDSNTQEQAMKAMWLIKALNSPGPWTESLETILDGMSITDFLYSNLSEKDIPFKLPKDCIWSEAIRAWCRINHRETITTSDDIISQQIWLNSHIKLKKGVLWLKHWYNQGILQVWDICNEDKRSMMSNEELQTIHGIKTNFLEIEKVKRAIPKEWKTKLRDSKHIPDISKAETELVIKCTNSGKGSKLAYNILLKKKAEGPENKLQQWLEELGIERDPKEILEAMIKTRNTLSNTKLQSFNFNYYIRNLTYGARLYKMSMAEDDKCGCGKKETISHLYWDCERVQELWQYVEGIYHQDLNLHISKEICLLNILDKNMSEVNKNLVRTINTITRHYIHTRKCEKARLNHTSLKNIIIKIRKLEWLIACENNAQEAHMMKWNKLLLP